MKRSFSQNTPLHIDHTRSDSLATPTLSKSRSPSPLGQSTSLPRSHQSLGNFHQTTVYSGTGLVSLRGWVLWTCSCYICVLSIV